MAASIKGKLVQVNRIIPENLQSYFVHNLVAQHQIDHFILSFFEVWPPMIVTETDEEKQRAIDALTSVDAKCVARLILTPAKMQEVVSVLSENLRRYDEKLKERETSESIEEE